MKSETIQALLAQGMTYEDIIDSIEDQLTAAEKKYLNMQEKALNIEGKLAKANEKLEKVNTILYDVFAYRLGPDEWEKAENEFKEALQEIEE